MEYSRLPENLAIKHPLKTTSCVFHQWVSHFIATHLCCSAGYSSKSRDTKKLIRVDFPLDMQHNTELQYMQCCGAPCDYTPLCCGDQKLDGVQTLSDLTKEPQVA